MIGSEVQVTVSRVYYSLGTSEISDDITSVLYPTDFIVMSEDIPSLGGCREGKGSIVYKAKGR